MLTSSTPNKITWRTFRIFFFSVRGWGKGVAVRVDGRGVGFYRKSKRGRGGQRRWRGWGGAQALGACLPGWGGQFFFFGAEIVKLFQDLIRWVFQVGYLRSHWGCHVVSSPCMVVDDRCHVGCHSHHCCRCVAAASCGASFLDVP